MAVTLLPAFFIVNQPFTNTVAQWTLWGSAVAGYIGVVFMLWMYALGTRAASALFFVDQASVLRAHSWLGKYGTLLIFLHPILITISYSESVLYSFLPLLSTEFETHVTLGRIAFLALLIIWVTSALTRGKLSYRAWKYVHFLSYAAVPFALLHIPDTGSSYATEIAARLYFFMIVLGFLFFGLLKARDILAFNKHRYRVMRNVEVTPGVFLLDLAPLGDPIVPMPGQYIFLKHDFLSEEHPFSVTQYDESDGTLTVTYKVFGRYTEQLRRVVNGAAVYAMGPFGEFTSKLDEMPATPAVYIAGGIGITPFIERIMSEGEEREQWLFYASKSPDNATYSRQLQSALNGKMVSLYSEGIDIHTTQSERGRITAATFTKYLGDVQRYDYFVCGPVGMMDAVDAELTSLGVSGHKIHKEEFSF